MNITAYVIHLETNRIGERATLFRVRASYEIPGVPGACGLASTIDFNVPMSEAAEWHVGQKITISVQKDE